MSRWWRAYDEAVDDPKLQCLSDECFRFWFNLCCVCSKFDGNFPPLKHVAFLLRMQCRKVERLLGELRECGLIDEDNQGSRPHNWNGRQYKSDVSTPRVKRFRERRRNVSETPPEYRVQSTEKKESVLCGRKATRTDLEFEKFWKAYPRRHGANPKHPAEKLFLAAVKAGADPEAIIGGAGRFAADPATKVGTEFVPQAVKWLRDKRWRDYPVVTDGENGHSVGHWIALDTPEWDAWSRHRGRPFALDKRGGWMAPSQWPPGYELQRVPECSMANPPFGIGED